MTSSVLVKCFPKGVGVGFSFLASCAKNGLLVDAFGPV